MPRRLFRASPSRLLAWVDCPRRYRMQYLDRPAPPSAARSAAHTSVGRGRAQRPARLVGPARPSSARPRPAPSWCAPRGSTSGFRDADQSRQWRERAQAPGHGLPRRRRPRPPAARASSAPSRSRPSTLALQGRDRPARRPRRRAGRRRLQDEPVGAHRRRRPHLAAARALCRRGVEDVPPQVRPRRAAPPAERHRRRPRAHRRVAQAQDRRGRVDRPRRPPGRGRLRRVRRRLGPLPGQRRAAVPVVRLPGALPGGSGVRPGEVRLGGPRGTRRRPPDRLGPAALPHATKGPTWRRPARSRPRSSPWPTRRAASPRRRRSPRSARPSPSRASGCCSSTSTPRPA